jgi:hypothetical protein
LCSPLRIALHRLVQPGTGFAFPCDSGGRVDIDELSACGRNNYFYARTVVGREFSLPIIALVTR